MKYVLIADDEREVRLILEAALTLCGYEAAGVEDGHRAISLCQARVPDLVITDLFMPCRDGLEVIMQLRQNFPTVKIIAMSGDLDAPKFLRMGDFLGADRTLAKPFLVPEVLQAVDELLN